ncbi:hypothetical protein CLV78_107158 [Aliiruegeria haliotis]|uniref:Uncharacterized protein n=1 Tax=Aliiruegeria haliotis TaxID=1280846 RepID=A0A2T0RM16_9RHOB|nr:hypothetical protein [Aliiruegeria haliotis]PRY22234.1 hypothetical protein CLV78_107158 [Aliiruegeria haliotis]
MLKEPVRVQEYACGENQANVVSVFNFDTSLPSVRLEYGDSIDFGSLTDEGNGRYDGNLGRSLSDDGNSASLT